MKATNFLLDSTRLTGFVGGLAQRNPVSSGKRHDSLRASAVKRSPSLLERLDRWFWRQQVKDREAYLAGAQDIFELEDRIRRLERAVGGRYY